MVKHLLNTGKLHSTDKDKVRTGVVGVCWHTHFTSQMLSNCWMEVPHKYVYCTYLRVHIHTCTANCYIYTHT